jgi:hypothetical protein
LLPSQLWPVRPDDRRWVLKHLDRAMASDTIAKLRGPDDQIR